MHYNQTVGKQSYFYLWARVCSVCTTCLAVNASKPVVGSSSRHTAGSAKSCTPRERRRFSPPEMPLSSASPTRVCAQWCRSRVVST